MFFNWQLQYKFAKFYGGFMTQDEEKKRNELLAKLKKLEEEQAALEEKYRVAGMPDCLGTSESLAAYQDKVNEINEEINKLL